MTFISIIFIILLVYLAAGLVFAIPFVIKGVTRIDEGAVGSKWGFRLIIVPGVIVFWPVLLKKWMNRAAERKQNVTNT